MVLYIFVPNPDYRELSENIRPLVSHIIELVEKKAGEINPVRKPDSIEPDVGSKVKEEQNKIPEGKLTITVLNINHGDAILLQDSKQTILIDTGHNANRDLVLKKLALRI